MTAGQAPRSRLRSAVAVVATFALAGVLCGCSADPKSSDKAADRTTPAPAASSVAPRVSGSFDVGARELFLECLGEGGPAVVLEPGQGDSRSTFAAIQSALADRTTVCTYDRANVGASGKAPIPRTSADVVKDLRALLAAAGVDGPYLLVGTSAGAFFSMHQARLHPHDVVGVVAMNPPPLAAPWVARAYPLLSTSEIANEKAFYRGDNPESIDWTTSSKQLTALPAPRDVPLVLLHSTAAQCEGDPPCLKTADLYLKLGAEYAAAWPGARFEAVDVSHQIQQDDQAHVVGLIEDMLDAAPRPPP